MEPMPIAQALDEALDVGAPFTDDEITQVLFPDTTHAAPALLERARRFRLESIPDLDWAGRGLRRATARREEIRAHVAGQIAHLKDWEARALAAPNARIEWFEQLAIDYANRQRQADNGRTKTVTAPSVKVAGKALGYTFGIADPKAFIAWARESAPDAVEDQDPKLIPAKVENVVVEEGENGTLHVMVFGEPVPGMVAKRAEFKPRVRAVEIRTKTDDEWTVREERVSYTVKPVGIAATEDELLEALGLAAVEDDET